MDAVKAVTTVDGGIVSTVAGFGFSEDVADVGCVEVAFDVFTGAPDGVVEAVTEVAGTFADASVVGEFTTATAAADGQR